MAAPVMVLLTTAGSTFEGRVVVARLGAHGILSQLRGSSEGPYPLPGTVHVLVDAAQLDEARQVLGDVATETLPGAD